MKLISHFNDFLKDVVNLNQSRIDVLQSRVKTITDFIKRSEQFAECYIESEAQGSWAHKTIIKPSDKSPSFDADVVIYLKQVDKWEPKDYIENLYSLFKASPSYRSLVKRNTRCVVIDYTGEFHLDVVPCIREEGLFGIFEDSEFVCNRLSNQLEETAPKRYTDWFLDNDKEVSNHQLIKAVRLAKYLRDIKGNFSVKSILLSTLIANQVGWMESYSDLPTTLKTLFNSLNSFLHNHPTMPIIKNPVLDSEDFNRHWDQTKYSNFREKIAFYTEKINAAYDEEKRSESVKKWREIFGNEFAKSVNIEAKSFSEETSPRLYIPNYEKPESHGWNLSYSTPCDISAIVHKSKNGEPLFSLQSNGRALSPGQWIQFKCMANTKDTNIYWQVVNTGPHVEQIGAGRGDIFSGSKHRWETAEYHGKHRIRCFVVRHGHCIAKSNWFFVNVWNDSWEG